jgi:hypothetical protein
MRAIRAAGWSGGVLCLDTLNRAAPTADENSSRDMGEILEAAKRLQAATGGLVVLVHHTGKDSSRGLRGHSSLFAAMDAAVEVSRDGDRHTFESAEKGRFTGCTAHWHNAATGKRVRAITYIADFAYVENGQPVTIDVKGARTEAYRIKSKLFMARYPHIRFEEVAA